MSSTQVRLTAFTCDAQIEVSRAGDDYFDAKVTVLSEMIKHHVKEKEQPGGMFAEATAQAA